MYKRFLVLFLAIGLIVLPQTSVVAALSQTETQKYILEKLAVNSSDTARVIDLKAKLEFEVNRMINKGHLKPAYFQIGIMGSYILWGYPGEQAYILSLTLPYLSAATQTKLKTFLAQEVRNLDPTSRGFEHCSDGWGNCELTGNRREFFKIPTSPDPDPITANIYPAPSVPAESLYMMWAYAQNTGDWAFISSSTPPQGTRWNNIKNIFGRIPASPTRYGEITGAIGYMRLLEHYNMQNDPSYAQAQNIVVAGMNAGLNFRTFTDTSYQNFVNLTFNHDWAFTPFHFLRSSNAVGAQFAPEIGRYLRDNALVSVQNVVSFNPLQGNSGQQPAIQSHWPTWYQTRGIYPRIRPWVGHYGENHIATPDTPWALFMIEAYVFEQSGDGLYRRLSAPAAIGDLYHIHKIVATIEAYGQKCWQNIKTGALNCTGQAPVDKCPNDINSDGLRDLGDYNVWTNNVFSTSPNHPRVDINKDGLVDLADYNLLAQDFLEVCPN